MKKSFGIIGKPIKHSLSPILHNYWFKKYNIDANYSILETEDNQLAEIINKIKNGELNGINVTLPYKQKILSNIDILINDAKTTSSEHKLFIYK